MFLHILLDLQLWPNNEQRDGRTNVGSSVSLFGFMCARAPAATKPAAMCSGAVRMGSMGSKEPINFHKNALKPINIWENSMEICSFGSKSWYFPFLE